MMMGIPMWVIFAILVIGLFLSGLIFFARQYKRCPSNKILVIYGSVGDQKSARCIHGGGHLVIPLVQDYTYLGLDPLTINIELTGALSKRNIRVGIPATFTIGISTRPTIMQSAAERLLDLTEQQISVQARDIILGQLRLVIATLSIEEINQDREKFLDLVSKNVGLELNKIGLEVINVNIRDITDESGYIEAIGKKAAAEAINQAKVEVAQQEQLGAIGEATANREKEVSVANQHAQSVSGQKEAEKQQRIAVAKLEAEGSIGEANAKREQEIAVAQQSAQTEQGRKEAEKTQRVVVAGYEADAKKGENESQAKIADYDAILAQRRAEAKRAGEVAMAEASRDVLQAEKEQEVALLEKTQLAQKEVDKKKIEVEAEAQAEQIRRIARGEADGVLAKYAAEAEGIRKVLEAKAAGYTQLMSMAKDERLVPTLLLIEKLPEIVAEQVKAIQNLKIEKITVWDGGASTGGEAGGSTAQFLRSLIGSLPPLHDLAKQAGVDLPAYLGTLQKPEAPDGPVGKS